MIPSVGTVPTTAAPIVNVLYGTKYRVTKMGFANLSGAERDIEVSLKVRGVLTQIFPAFTLTADQVLEDYTNFDLDGGDQIVAETDDDNVTFHILGYRL